MKRKIRIFYKDKEIIVKVMFIFYKFLKVGWVCVVFNVSVIFFEMRDGVMRLRGVCKVGWEGYVIVNYRI